MAVTSGDIAYLPRSTAKMKCRVMGQAGNICRQGYSRNQARNGWADAGPRKNRGEFGNAVGFLLKWW